MLFLYDDKCVIKSPVACQKYLNIDVDDLCLFVCLFEMD